MGGAERWRIAWLALLLALAALPVGGLRAQVQGEETEGETLRIIGGHPARTGAWPSMVALYSNQGSDSLTRMGPTCGATVIGREWALTAGHCVAGTRRYEPRRRIEAQDLMIVEGTINITSNRGRQIAVRQIVRRPDYGANGQTVNDVALLRLAEPSQMPRQPLASRAARAALEAPGRVATVTGFGAAGTGRNASGSSDLLQVDLPLLAMTQCAGWYRGRISPLAFGEFAICAGYEAGGRDSCQGDSGGPLFVMGPMRRMVQIGVVSWGKGCAQPRSPGLYASVAHFEAWIRQHVPDADFGEAAGVASPSPGPVPAPSQPRPFPRPIPAPQPARPQGPWPELFLPLQQALQLPPETAPSAVQQVSLDLVEGTTLREGGRGTLRIGSSLAGRLVVLVLDPAGGLTQLLPNQLAGPSGPGQVRGTLRPGDITLLPGPADGFALLATPPFGENWLVALVLPASPAVDQVVGRHTDLRPIPDPRAHVAALAELVRAEGGRAAATGLTFTVAPR